MISTDSMQILWPKSLNHFSPMSHRNSFRAIALSIAYLNRVKLVQIINKNEEAEYTFDLKIFMIIFVRFKMSIYTPS